MSIKHPQPPLPAANFVAGIGKNPYIIGWSLIFLTSIVAVLAVVVAVGA